MCISRLPPHVWGLMDQMSIEKKPTAAFEQVVQETKFSCQFSSDLGWLWHFDISNIFKHIRPSNLLGSPILSISIYFDIYPDASMQQLRVRVGIQLDSRSPAWQEKFPETEAFDYGPSLARKLYNLAAKMKIQKHRELWLKATLWQD